MKLEIDLGMCKVTFDMEHIMAAALVKAAESKIIRREIERKERKK